MDELLQTYARLTQRTVLRPAALPSMPPDIVTHLPSDTNAAIRSIEILLRAGQLDLLPDGEQFVGIVPVGWSNSPAASFLATIKPPTPVGEVRPAGVVNWSGSGGADLLQVLDIYSKLRVRTVLRSAQLQTPTIKLATTTPLTTDEICYGLTVVLALNGIAALVDGEKLVQLVPVREWKSIETHAPRTEQGVALLDPKVSPRLAPQPQSPARSRLTQLYRQFFEGEPPWTPRPVDRLIEFYADLNDQKAAPSKSCDGGLWCSKSPHP